MNYQIKIAISYVHPDGRVELHAPGETASLNGWPAEDLARFEQQGIIERAVEPEPVKPSRKAVKESDE